MALRRFSSAYTLGASSQSRRNAPGTAGFPTADARTALNASVSGRLAAAVPFAQFCKDCGGCTETGWTSGSFNASVPGAMDSVYLSISLQLNWKQDYYANPP
ncbi:hypothetical protein BDZ89DRAFT_1144299 [Hymenopellis radicata]|nr:hypothetical protein BDZ89DRAFT_1144299 [Hymenopellis radicata]